MRQYKAENVKNEKMNRRISEKNQKAWKSLSSSKRYKCHLAKERSMRAADNIKEEMYDGIFLELGERNCDKSFNVQKRILRRIVEKRQAKASFRTIGHSTDLLFAHVTTKATSKCFARLRKQNCFAA